MVKVRSSSGKLKDSGALRTRSNVALTVSPMVLDVKTQTEAVRNLETMTGLHYDALPIPDA
jgi:hypothetical protein